ncbi:pyridoxal phosphate-dependent transferase [Suillus subalutaceus]|uniref:pyridoxal phosphate-dependent transferase n=1 Tax=Suillus subalutaceus TaxID=48586 RepID=UPI001B8631B7|nr:pyridoxal phosphate-dependent transferase [Suillus subalutaceus]KAG1861137.1 pyridoxal phosphate-dependent transferase [Suillus subalutaceus]
MPSLMTLNPPSPSPSIFKEKESLSQLSSITTAVSYLSAIQRAESRARTRDNPHETPTPALSLSSSITTSSEDIAFNEDDENNCLVNPHTPPTSEQVFTTPHTEFGHCANEAYRCVSKHDYTRPFQVHTIEEPPYYIHFATYISFLILHMLGHLRDFFGKRFAKSHFTHLMPHNGYAPLNSDFDSFFPRRLKRRMDDCYGQPITGVPGRTVLILDRYSPDYNHTQVYTGGKTRALNISSYNYLAFSQGRGSWADAVTESIRRYGVSSCGTRLDSGSNDLHVSAEALIAHFLGTEDALVCSMGFATNSTFIPGLAGKGSLIISDELNHTSMRVGIRQSGAEVRIFKHNNMSSLESLLREVISQGQPKTHRAWKNILVIVEGLYSMEGTLVNLPRIVELKQKYKFYLYIDEAHSIGSLGSRGRGVTDYFNVPPGSIDVLMGTFSKGFGAAGGYIAGSKPLIDALRLRSHSGPYAEAITPSVITQVVVSMASIMGVAPAPQPTKSTLFPSLDSSIVAPKESAEELPGMAPASMLPTWMNLRPSLADGSEARVRMRRLAFNCRYLHMGLKKLGFIVYGHASSPIVPLLIFNPGKLPLFVRMMRARPIPIVVVVVTYPATSFETGRVRLCPSASHTKEDIDIVLRACDEVGGILDMKHGSCERWGIDEVCERAVELVHSV